MVSSRNQKWEYAVVDVEPGIVGDVDFDRFRKLIDDIDRSPITVVVLDSIIIFHKSSYTTGPNSSLGAYIHVSGAGIQATLANPDKYMFTMSEAYVMLKGNKLLDEVIHNLKLELLAQM